MQTADSTARTVRPSEDAILKALERLSKRESARASGFYSVGDVAEAKSSQRPPADPFAGLERLDRAELDETDEG
jgi:hypothetical protein